VSGAQSGQAGGRPRQGRGPIAITGPSGRLGRALVARLEQRGPAPYAWGRSDFDLDEPDTLERLVHVHRPDLVIHTAAWTDVDGAAREPELARRRNGEAVGALARACRREGAALVYVSTNEVFDGLRNDGRGYAESDTPSPANAYGRSKLEGERLAAAAFGGEDPRRPAGDLWIVRTAWLFGPGAPDFPSKILGAADRLEPGESLRVVDDEIGSPTSADDLAGAILDLLDRAPAGLYHLVNEGAVSRFAWATAVLAGCRSSVGVIPISRTAFTRASNAPPWAVLDSSKARDLGVTLRRWEDAFGDYVPALCP
jgi:dTDP-4-dehydrorhamnose reductase